MKFLEMSNIIKTNALLSRLQAFDPKRSVEIEAYSCKQTKEQKKHRDIPKPLRFYISALELAFPDFDFSEMSLSGFNKITYNVVRNELSYVFFTIYKNCDDVEEFVVFLDTLLEQCINIKAAKFFLVDGTMFGDSDFHKIFLIYDSQIKRVVIIKSVLEKMVL